MKDKLTFEQECSLIANGEDLPKEQEKQIEEMAKDCCLACAELYGECNCKKDKCPSVKLESKRLIEKGWIKPDKNSVVLSREEYEILTKDIEHPSDEVLKKFIVGKNILTEQVIEKVSKETAEKFLQLAYDRCLEKSFIKKVEELAKSLGVEIKE